MEAGFRLRQINQILWDALIFKGLANHVLVAAATHQGVLKILTSAAREIGDVAGHLVGHHQRQVGVGVFDLSFRLRFGSLIGRRSYIVGFINRSRFRGLYLLCLLLLCILLLNVLFSSLQLIEFLLQTWIRLYIYAALSEQLKRMVILGFRSFQSPSFELNLACFIFLLYLSHKVSHCVHFGNQVDFRLGCRGSDVRLCRSWRWSGYWFELGSGRFGWGGESVRVCLCG